MHVSFPDIIGDDLEIFPGFVVQERLQVWLVLFIGALVIRHYSKALINKPSIRWECFQNISCWKKSSCTNDLTCYFCLIVLPFLSGNFHIRNGACMWRLNWFADLSARGLQNSFGLMVNYRYVLEEVDKNNQQYLLNGTVAASPQFLELL